MILKKFKKNIALALAVITISIPASNVIYANENYNSSQPSISLDQINIDEIHNMFNSIESNVDSKKSNNSNIIEINAEGRSEEHTSELQSRFDIVCRLLLEKKNSKNISYN